MFALERLPLPFFELVARSPSLARIPSFLARRRYARSAKATTPIKLRFAPSPTGYLHLGGLRTALFNHLLARKLGGTWVLRIEDTDQTRYVEGAVESLIKTLDWAGLDCDEGPNKELGRGPYFQSQRKAIYNQHLDRLIEQGHAYHCFCTPSRLAKTRELLKKSGSSDTYDRKCLSSSKEETAARLGRGETSVVRFKSSGAGLVQHDLVYDTIAYDSLPVEDFVLRKSDGLPTYHFANVVDDHEMGITHVLRGEEWISSTPKHLALYAALKFDPPQFAHLPLLINPDGSKLSKRAGDVRVEDYITKGYEPEALLNFVALMGWNPGSDSPTDTSEVMTMKDLIESFKISGINKNRATMSPTKLDFLNRAHLKLKVQLGNDAGRADVSERLRQVLATSFPGSETKDLNYVGRVISALKDRVHTINDVPTLGAYFFVKPDLTAAPARQLFATVSREAYFQAINDSIKVVQELSEDSFEEANLDQINAPLTAIVGKEHVKVTKDLMNPLRHALTGQKVGASVAATISTLGREESLARLGFALNAAK